MQGFGLYKRKNFLYFEENMRISQFKRNFPVYFSITKELDDLAIQLSDREYLFASCYLQCGLYDNFIG